ncbi:hypothetical protein RQP46_008804 [Phenoliferia psychrophenolica]
MYAGDDRDHGDRIGQRRHNRKGLWRWGCFRRDEHGLSVRQQLFHRIFIKIFGDCNTDLCSRHVDIRRKRLHLRDVNCRCDNGGARVVRDVFKHHNIECSSRRWR